MMAINQQQQGVQLAELLAGWSVGEIPAVVVTGLQLDSRKIIEGDLFVAYQGAQVNGQDFIPQAVAQGAAAVVTDTAYTQSINVPVIVYPGLSAQLSELAGRFYGHPSHRQSLIGVTGTNGKTSCTQFIMQLLNLLQKSCAVIGTLGAGVDGKLQAGLNTTPDAIDLQASLASWQDIDCVAMEVSSHGLAQGRVAALQFDVALFTNLSRDHLDYHGDMACYGAEKARLFSMAGLQTAVLNLDDEFTQTLQQKISGDVSCISYSIAGTHSDVYASEVEYHQQGFRANIHSPWGDAKLQCGLFGHFNLSNVMAAISCLAVKGYDFEQLVAVAGQLQPVEGRMEMLAAVASAPVVVIDYAHTPDALEQALSALRLHVGGKLHCVFGCGGDRDQGKRPLMGEIAQRLADVVWVTSDNPRTENADNILQQIVEGMAADNSVNGSVKNSVNTSVNIETDRALAIEKAIASAGSGDVILIAGKGHEDYQQIGTERLPFNDAKQARLALNARESGRAGA